MKLLVPIFLNCVFVTIFYLLDKKTAFKKFNYISKQLLIGVVFGGLSAFASGYGVEFLGTVANVRDAAPLCAGLILLSQAYSVVCTASFPFTGEQGSTQE